MPRVDGLMTAVAADEPDEPTTAADETVEPAQEAPKAAPRRGRYAGVSD